MGRKKKSKGRPELIGIHSKEVVQLSKPELYLKSENELVPAFYWPVYSVDKDIILPKEMPSFPTKSDLKTSLQAAHRYEHSHNESIELADIGSFWNAVFDSKLVYIVDKFFSIKEFNIIMKAIKEKYTSELKNLTIICSNECEQLRRERRERRDSISFDLHIYDLYFRDWKLRYSDYGDQAVDRCVDDSTYDDFCIEYPSKIKCCRKEKEKRDDESLFNIHDRFAWMDGEIWHFGSTVGGIKPHVTAYSRGWFDHDCRFKEYIDTIIVGQRD